MRLKPLEFNKSMGRPECPYMVRVFLLNLYFVSFRLHHWLFGDDPRYKHDHSWNFWTIVLWGGYTDISIDEHGNEIREHLSAGSIRYRSAVHTHTVAVDAGGCWTLVIAGPMIRKWGFWVGKKHKKPTKYFIEHGHHPCQD